jgi:hypothetical protein
VLWGSNSETGVHDQRRQSQARAERMPAHISASISGAPQKTRGS